MPISSVTLSEAVRAIGKAFVYAGDAFTADGLTPLGATEGEITVEEQETYNDLTAPEYTGEAIHERRVLHGSALVTIPLILGAADVYDKISATGSGAGGGHSTQQAAVTTNLLIIPVSEVGAGLSYDGMAWTPAAPVHAIWLWRAVAEAHGNTFRHEDGGKVIQEITFRALFDDARPEGHKLWTRGDPAAAAIAVLI